MSASEPDRAMTAYHLFEGKGEPVIPGPPPLPTGTGPTEPSTGPPPTQLDQIEDRIAKLEDALYSPDGLLHTLFASLDRKAQERHEVAMRGHEEIMRTLTTIANGQSELSDRLAKLEPKVEEHEAELRLVALHGEPVAATGAE